LDKLAGKIRFEIVSRHHPSNRLFDLYATRLEVLRWHAASSEELMRLNPYEAFLQAQEKSTPFLFSIQPFGVEDERWDYVAGRIPGLFGPYDNLEVESTTRSGQTLKMTVRHRLVAQTFGELWAASRAYFMLPWQAVPSDVKSIIMEFTTDPVSVPGPHMVHEKGEPISFDDQDRFVPSFVVRFSPFGAESLSSHNDGHVGAQNPAAESPGKADSDTDVPQTVSGEEDGAPRVASSSGRDAADLGQAAGEAVKSEIPAEALKFEISARSLALDYGSVATTFDARWWSLPKDRAAYLAPYEAYLLAEEQAAPFWRSEGGKQVGYVAGRIPGEIGCLDEVNAVYCSQEKERLIFSASHVRFRDDFHGFDWTAGRLYFMIREADIPASVKVIEIRFDDFFMPAEWGVKEEGEPQALPEDESEFIGNVTIDLDRVRSEGRQAFGALKANLHTYH
jgi:hypothetical protein